MRDTIVNILIIIAGLLTLPFYALIGAMLGLYAFFSEFVYDLFYPIYEIISHIKNNNKKNGKSRSND